MSAKFSTSAQTSGVLPRDLKVARIHYQPEKEVELATIMAALRDLELLDSLQQVKPKSGNSYKDAARALYPLWHDVDSGKSSTVTFQQIKDTLPTVYSIAWNAIAELLETGKIAKLTSLTKKDKFVIQLLQVHGVGPIAAERFATTPKVKSYDDLAAHCKLSKKQVIGLRHREDINRLIPRKEMDKLRGALEEAVKEADDRFECEILGSYRRGIAFSSDIDLVVRHPVFEDAAEEETANVLMAKILTVLGERRLIANKDQLSCGPKRYAGLIKMPRHAHFRRIDIRIAPYHSYPYMLLGSSGDALLLKLLRSEAKRRGWCLNEYGMGDKFAAEDQNPNGFRAGTSRVVNDEREIFELLGFPYLKPEQRDFTTWRAIYKAAGVDVSWVDRA